MSENILELGVFTARSIMGIDQSQPVIVDFTNMKKNQKYVEAESDQGTGKSSWQTGVLLAMGASLDIPKVRLFNSKDEAVDIDQTFTYNGEEYHVFVDKTRVTLKKKNENGKWKAEDSPQSLLRKIFGPVALSPFNVRHLDGKKQIEYFQQMFGSGEDASKKMREVENTIDTKFTERTGVNGKIKELSSALKLEPLYINREESEKRFAKPIIAEKEKKKFDDLAKKKADYDRYDTSLKMLRLEQKGTDDEIYELEQHLKEAKAMKVEIDTRVEKGDAWMEENKNVVTEYEAANEDWIQLSKKLADQEKWKEILKKDKELDTAEQKAIVLTGEVEDGREQLLKLTKKCLPDVEGLTIKIAAGLDKTKPTGVFYSDQPLHELSQSEYEALWAKIFVASGAKFLFFENTNNFGSETIGILNNLMKEEGVVVMGTRTNPKIKEFGVSFKSKID